MPGIFLGREDGNRRKDPWSFHRFAILSCIRHRCASRLSVLLALASSAVGLPSGKLAAVVVVAAVVGSLRPKVRDPRLRGLGDGAPLRSPQSRIRRSHHAAALIGRQAGHDLLIASGGAMAEESLPDPRHREDDAVGEGGEKVALNARDSQRRPAAGFARWHLLGRVRMHDPHRTSPPPRGRHCRERRRA